MERNDEKGNQNSVDGSDITTGKKRFFRLSNNETFVKTKVFEPILFKRISE